MSLIKSLIDKRGNLRNFLPILRRSFPGSSEAWAAAFPHIAEPTAIHTAQESSAPLVDGIGSFNLDTVTGSPVYAQPGDPTGRRAWGTDALGERVTPTLPTELDFFGSFSVWVRCKVPDNGASNRSLLGKRIGGGAGWYLGVLANSGHPFCGAYNEATVTTQISGTDVADGEWRDWLVAYDATAEQLTLYVGDAEASNAVTGSLAATTAYYTLGGLDGVAQAEIGTLISYHAAWNGTVITREEFDVLRRS